MCIKNNRCLLRDLEGHEGHASSRSITPQGQTTVDLYKSKVHRLRYDEVNMYVNSELKTRET